MNNDEKEIDGLKGIIVGWKVFSWAMGIVLLLFGVCFTAISSLSLRVDEGRVEYAEIKTQLSQIQTDLVWLKQAMINK